MSTRAVSERRRDREIYVDPMQILPERNVQVDENLLMRSAITAPWGKKLDPVMGCAASKEGKSGNLGNPNGAQEMWEFWILAITPPQRRQKERIKWRKI